MDCFCAAFTFWSKTWQLRQLPLYSTQTGKFRFCKMKKSFSFLTSIYSQGKVSNFMYREIWTNSCQCWKGLAVLKKRGMWLKSAKIIQSHYLLVLECFSWQLIKSAGFGSWSKIVLEVTDDYGKRVTVMPLAYCEDLKRCPFSQMPQAQQTWQR